MDVKIIETGKIEELSIIDLKSGVDWINDLMGNHGALPEYDEDQDVFLMTQETFDWWRDLTQDLEAAEYRLAKLDYDDEERWEFIGSCDLEDLPGLIEQFCDTLENTEE